MPFLKTNFESLAPIFVSLMGCHVARRGKEKASMLARCVEGESATLGYVTSLKSETLGAGMFDVSYVFRVHRCCWH